jgi:hypothetical protein
LSAPGWSYAAAATPPDRAATHSSLDLAGARKIYTLFMQVRSMPTLFTSYVAIRSLPFSGPTVAERHHPRRQRLPKDGFSGTKTPAATGVSSRAAIL